MGLEPCALTCNISNSLSFPLQLTKQLEAGKWLFYQRVNLISSINHGHQLLMKKKNTAVLLWSGWFFYIIFYRADHQVQRLELTRVGVFWLRRIFEGKSKKINIVSNHQMLGRQKKLRDNIDKSIHGNSSFSFMFLDYLLSTLKFKQNTFPKWT